MHNVNLELLNEYEQLIQKMNGVKADCDELAKKNKKLSSENKQLLTSNDEF